MKDARTAKIAKLNDLLRTGFRTGSVHFTAGIYNLGPAEKDEILQPVRTFTAFAADNDPHGEHDCAVLEAAGHRIIFKIDYYDATLTHGSVDPSDPNLTRRVLTIMLAEEY